MTRGPYGITSQPTVFLAVYRALLAAILVYNYLERRDNMMDYLKLTKGKKKKIKINRVLYLI